MVRRSCALREQRTHDSRRLGDGHGQRSHEKGRRWQEGLRQRVSRLLVENRPAHHPQKKEIFFPSEKKKNRPAHASDMSLRIVIVDVRKEAMTHFAARGHLVARYGGSRLVVSVLP